MFDQLELKPMTIYSEPDDLTTIQKGNRGTGLVSLGCLESYVGSLHWRGIILFPKNVFQLLYLEHENYTKLSLV